MIPISIPAKSIPGWIFGTNLVTSYGADNVKFTDGQTDAQRDGQTQAMTIHLRPERSMGKNIHIHENAFENITCQMTAIQMC